MHNLIPYSILMSSYWTSGNIRQWIKEKTLSFRATRVAVQFTRQRFLPTSSLTYQPTKKDSVTAHASVTAYCKGK